MKLHAIGFLLTFGAIASCNNPQSEESRPAEPLSGTVAGSSFAVVGSRTAWVEGDLVVTLTNVEADCSGEPAISDGRIRVDLRLDTSEQKPGTYGVGSDGVRVGVTRTTMVGDVPKFDGVSLADGAVWIDRYDTDIGGALRAQYDANDIHLSGAFQVSLCP